MPRRGLSLCALFAFAFLSTSAGAAESPAITHGPMLGRLSAHGVAIWVRTARPGTFRVRYGTSPGRLEAVSPPARTELGHDCAAFVELGDLKSGTRYHYEVFVPGGPTPDASHRGSFRTLPDPRDARHPELNPRGLFNFSFEYACGNHQRARPDGRVELPAYETMLEHLPRQIDFAILNGDWLYEERRDWPVEKWRELTGAAEDDVPAIVRNAPNIVGVWENYRLYLDRAEALRRWHRQVPSFLTLDDHELVDDIHGAGSVGLRDRRAVFRDIGVRAWFDYLGWSNPTAYDVPVHFGRGTVRASEDVLHDPHSDFTRLDLEKHSNLHIHWGGPDAGRKEKSLDNVGGDPNAGVYEVVEILDDHRLRIRPPAKEDGRVAYSIGRYSFGRLRLANCDFFFLDTRSHRMMPDRDRPDRPGLTLLGERQKKWLKEQLQASDADFLFLLSSVNFMIPHILDVGEPTFAGVDDSWTVFLRERNEMLDFFDGLGKPVLILTGDLHNSIVVKVTDRVWEFASGPHNSGNARAASEGDRPANGPFDSRGRCCHIRWSTHFRADARPKRQPVYCVVQVNNVYNNPEAGRDRWIAFPHPHVVFRYYDGLTGQLLYAEPIHARGDN